MKTRIITTIIFITIATSIFGQGFTSAGVHHSGGYSTQTNVSSIIGTDNFAYGTNSFAGGLNSYASGAQAIALGTNDTVTANGAFAFGFSNKVTGTSSFAIGIQNRAEGQACIALGAYANTTNDFGITIGSGISDLYPLSNTAKSIMLGVNSINPTLYISESPNDGKEYLDRTGRVSIGAIAPQTKLHIYSDSVENAGLFLEARDKLHNNAFIQFQDSTRYISVETNNQMHINAGNNNLIFHANKYCLGTDSTFMSVTNNQGLLLFNPERISLYSQAMALEADTCQIGISGSSVILSGKVGVNTMNTTYGYALAVDGGIITTKVHIQDVGDWEDRVFDRDYPLMPLGEVEEYVAANRHLPGVPSEAEVKAEGFDLAEMQAVLLGKIEELTLYTVRQQREIDSLRDLVTVRFGYDACGNRVSRTLEFSRTDGEKGSDGSKVGASLWQASLCDSFAGVETMLFPNPTQGGFFLTFTGEEIPDGATATLCSVDGKTIEERAVVGFAEEFDLGGMPAGVYLLRFSTKDTVKTWKIVKR